MNVEPVIEGGASGSLPELLHVSVHRIVREAAPGRRVQPDIVLMDVQTPR